MYRNSLLTCYSSFLLFIIPRALYQLFKNSLISEFHLTVAKGFFQVFLVKGEN